MNVYSILLVEDNRDDEELALLAFRMDRIKAELIVARDGVEALEYLFPKVGSHPLPSIILLDLKLPRLDGLEVLRRIRSDPRTRDIPVAVITSSTEEVDQRSSTELGVEAYVRKPMDFQEFREQTRKMAETWLRPELGTEGSS